MRKPPPAPDDRDDAELFRMAIGADRGKVRALPATPAPPAAPRPKPSTRMARRDDDEAREELRRMPASALEAGDALVHRRDDVPAQVLRRLARGEYAAQEELDLHGLSVHAAETLCANSCAIAAATAWAACASSTARAATRKNACRC